MAKYVEQTEGQQSENAGPGARGTSRRELLAGAAALTVGTAIAGTDVLARQPKPPAGKSRIVVLEHPGASLDKTKLDEPVVIRMIEEALKTYAGTDSAPAALLKFFRPGQKIALKISTLGSPYSAVNKVTAYTLAELLHKAGVPKDNIRIFDQYHSRMKTAGYPVRRRPGEIWVSNAIGKDPAVQVYEYEASNGRKVKVHFHWCQEVVWADAILNVCVPKDHDLAGITGALKNVAFGCLKPTDAQYANKNDPSYYSPVPRFHRNCCDPGIPWLYSQPMMKDKVKLIVADALRVLYHGGPQDKPRWRVLNNQIWVAEDPVAHDAHVLDVVQAYRKANGMKPVEEDLFRGQKRLPTHIATAAKMGLGTNDPSRISVEKKVLS